MAGKKSSNNHNDKPFLININEDVRKNTSKKYFQEYSSNRVDPITSIIQNFHYGTKVSP